MNKDCFRAKCDIEKVERGWSGGIIVWLWDIRAWFWVIMEMCPRIKVEFVGWLTK